MKFITLFTAILIIVSPSRANYSYSKYCNTFDISSGITNFIFENYDITINPYPNSEGIYDKNIPFYEIIIKNTFSKITSTSHWFNDGDRKISIERLDQENYCGSEYIILTLQFKPPKLSETKLYTQKRLFFDAITLKPEIEIFDPTNGIYGRTVSSSILNLYFDAICTGNRISNLELKS